MRRVIKPFAVEIRGGDRKSRASEPKAPAWPELTDQPAVQWPDALLPPTVASEPAQTAGQEPATQTVEPYRDPRKPPPARAVVPDAAVTEAQPEKRIGRVLPVIETPQPIKAEEIIIARSPTARAKRGKAGRTEEPIAVEPETMPEAAAATVDQTALPTGRRGADRPTRGEFKRGERWKARLPAVVHRDSKRRG